MAERIETKWQDEWERRGTFWAANPAGPLTDAEGRHADPAAAKFFVMDMFPYPSGKGLHVGHPLGYIATDVVGRYRRMHGDNVLHALGYDAFGLPAEQYALQTGQHPRVTTEANIATMRAQLRRLGLAHDARRSYATTDESYVRWTQWIFLRMFNSWYDPSARRRDGGVGAARPIAELEEAFAAGRKVVPGGSDWNALDASGRRAVLNQYRLAYITDAPVNWAPGLGTVLANEEVTAEGRSERGNFPVFTKSLRQWNMRITAYAERLAADLDSVDWPEKVVAMQRNWIGRSTGATVDFAAATSSQSATVGSPGVASPSAVSPVDDAAGSSSPGASGSPSGAGHRSPSPGRVISVFTTRPDTLFGATFMVVSPEYPLLREGLPEAWPLGTKAVWTGGFATPRAAVAAYAAAAAKMTAAERVAQGREKSGVFTGLFAVNPVNDQPIPVFTADYVLMGYGTGAIMAVPAEDERDWEFAQAFELPHIRTVQPPADWEGGAWTGPGITINSANPTISLDGLDVAEAKSGIVRWLAERGLGAETVTYRLRDWLFSRQRYWGEPFPIVYGQDNWPVALPDRMLPVELPEVPDYRPRTFDPQDAASEPETPLARNPEWANVTLDLGDGPKAYRRDTNTMPNWAGSCWYYLRYLDPDESDRVVDPVEEDYWMAPRAEGDVAGGVDLYVGGVEHAVLHLLYARFWHKVLYDLGFVSGTEPFHRLFNQGYIQAYAYADARGQYVPAEEVVEQPPGVFIHAPTGETVEQEYGKMGKSLKNIVTPDEMYATYGADTFRLYEMSMGPLDVSRPWETRAVVGLQRFLQRLWRNAVDEADGAVRVAESAPDEATLRVMHRVVAEVRQEMDAMRFNTAIARMIVLNNHLTSLDSPPRLAVETLVKLLAPVAPHISEELWQRLGHAASLAHEPYPVADPAYLVEEAVTAVVQIQGKVRARLSVPPGISASDLEAIALDDAAVVAALAGRPVRRVISRPPTLVNLVV
ncbi:MAG: leucine--tRNA ligase [Bifidobacteriaceae bacterium]|nr:leucine--tRNA ligase [Bifidobacteriaceae bacterium]